MARRYKLDSNCVANGLFSRMKSMKHLKCRSLDLQIRYIAVLLSFKI
jgi:hypothetical protein